MIKRIEYVIVQVAALERQALSYAVAVTQGLFEQLDWCFDEDEEGNSVFFNIWTEDEGSYRPDHLWEVGGPLIQSEQIDLQWNGSDGLASWWEATHQDRAYRQIGDTPLIAACRAIVAARFGDTVSVPKELL